MLATIPAAERDTMDEYFLCEVDGAEWAVLYHEATIHEWPDKYSLSVSRTPGDDPTIIYRGFKDIVEPMWKVYVKHFKATPKPAPE